MDISLIIALYGALQSTGLFIHKILKEHKKLSIILEYVVWYERAQILVSNSGHRPITLMAISTETFIPNGENIHWEIIPQTPLFDEKTGSIPFPVTLKDGEAVSITLGSILSEILSDNKLTAKLTIYDSEGKAYSNFRTRIYDPKWGGNHE